MSSPTGRSVHSPTRAKSAHSLAFHSCVSGELGAESMDEDVEVDELESTILENAATWANDHRREGEDVSDIIGYGTSRKRNDMPVVFHNVCIPNPFGGHLLLNVSGVLLSGKITAILGSDESEVTALVTALAGALEDDQYTGNIFYNRTPIGPWYRRSVVGFARKNGVFVSRSLSVRQNLLISLELHLQMSNYELNKTVDGVLDIVDLTSKQGRSVNELDLEARMRLTIAQELLLDPTVLFVESPTGGLGYSASLSIMKLLRRLAGIGKTVVVTLHQPRWKVYNIVDNLVLIHGGRMAYFGKAGEEAIGFFQSRGMIWSRNYTPTDFLLQLCKTEEAGWNDGGEDTPQMDARSLEEEFIQSAEYQTHLYPFLKDVAKDALNATSVVSDESSMQIGGREPSELRRLFILLRSIAMRQWAHKWWNVARVAVTIMLVIGMCKLYEFQKLDQAGLQNRVGITFFTVIVLMLVNIPAASTLIRHRPVFIHLRASGCYNTLTYWLCCVVWELLVIRLLFTIFFMVTSFQFVTFHGNGGTTNLAGLIAVTQTAFFALAFAVGSMAGSVSSAATVLEALFAFFIVTGGLLINSRSIPSWLQWVQKISYFRYCYESLLVNMFHGNDFGCDIHNITLPSSLAAAQNTPVPVDPQCFTGDSYLELQDFDVDNKWFNMYILIGMSVFFLLVSLTSLWIMKPPLVVSKVKKIWYYALYEGLLSLWEAGTGELPNKLKSTWNNRGK
eukprot:TRINITY_DN6209_c0_g1_i1.p1 TRINITY_DN6209_c0_g1~~TRINITY_DN6209_c0_g1_i1.p1  ORF type:complete len:732 (+),score=161.06 TRINITY_DN6209_c0_g1_i1:1207-3402(+)